MPYMDEVSNLTGLPVIVSEVVDDDKFIIATDPSFFGSGTSVVMHPLMWITLKHRNDIWAAHEERWAWILKHRIDPMVERALKRLGSE